MRLSVLMAIYMKDLREATDLSKAYDPWCDLNINPVHCRLSGAFFQSVEP